MKSQKPETAGREEDNLNERASELVYGVCIYRCVCGQRKWDWRRERERMKGGS